MLRTKRTVSFVMTENFGNAKIFHCVRILKNRNLKFRCAGTNKCISESLRCDKYVDCADASDEVDCYDDDEIPTR